MEPVLQMRNYRFILFLLLFLPLAASAENGLFTVTQVMNGKSFIVDSGDKVRLASIQAPNAQEEDTPLRRGRPGEPLGTEAKQALSALILGKKIRIDYNPGKRDRHSRLLGQVYDEKGTWIQGEMLKQGYAMVYSFNDDSHDIIEKMLAAERTAQKKNLGIWNHPYYHTLKPEETGSYLNHFKIVEGKVVSVNNYHGHAYINFSEHWKGNFAVFISKKFADEFADMHLKSLVGKKIRVRGWINYHNAPMMDITRPEQIEIE
jgi:endonuclease YncB( thermonuclease family)